MYYLRLCLNYTASFKMWEKISKLYSSGLLQIVDMAKVILIFYSCLAEKIWL